MSDLAKRLEQWLHPVRDWPMRSMDDDLREAASDLVRLTAETGRYRSAIRWALGYDEGEPEFRERRDGDKPYYWRAELARRAGAGVRDIKEAGNG